MKAMTILANKSKTSKNAKVIDFTPSSTTLNSFTRKYAPISAFLNFERGINEHRDNQKFRRAMMIH